MKTRLGSLTIASGATTSDELGFNLLRWMDAIAILGPAALTGSVKVQINPSRSGSTGWVDLQSGGADVTVPAGDSVVISPVPAVRLRLVSSLAEAAERTFPVVGDEKPL